MATARKNHFFKSLLAPFLLTWRPSKRIFIGHVNEIQNLTAEQLRKVLALKEKIERLQNQLDAVATGAPMEPTVAIARRRRRMSSAARARIASAQRARWAKVKAEHGGGGGH